MDRAELSRRRKAEGYQACARLGVREEDVHFLDLPDGNLTDRRKEGAAALADLFARNPLGQFFIPHRLEPPPDHAAVTAMATDAVRKARLGGDLFEYPVWMWARWPWVPRREDRRSRGRTKARQAAILEAGVREIITELRWRTDVRSRIAAKREALACHQTQTVRLLEPTEWPVLGDIADGEFLECFFSGWEYFRRSRIPE
jgi:LmbE family N-acetylglucosaminyl deacetylase